MGRLIDVRRDIVHTIRQVVDFMSHTPEGRLRRIVSEGLSWDSRIGGSKAGSSTACFTAQTSPTFE